MRVLILSAAPCITDARVRATARTLANLGHTVDVICRRAVDDADAPLEEMVGRARLRRANFDDITGFKAGCCPRFWISIILSGLFLLRRAALFLGQPSAARMFALTQEFWSIAPHAASLVEKADVVHAVGLPALPSAAKLAKQWGACLHYDAIELEFGRNAKYFWFFKRLRLWFEARFIAQADTVTTVSPEIALHLARHYGVLQPSVIHNMAMALPSRETIRTHLGVAPETPLAIYIGAVANGRGLLPSLEMLHHAPEFFLGVVGPREERFRARFEMIAGHKGVSARVGMAAARPPSEAAAFVSSANVALALVEPVCLSYAYALPNKLFQAVQAGLPVLVGRTPALRRLVLRWGLGESVDERDAVAVAAAVRRQAARQNTGEYRAARALFLSQFDEGQVVSAWARLYGRLILKQRDKGHSS